MLVVGSPLDMAGRKTEKVAQAILGPQNLTVFEKILILTGAEWSSVLVAGSSGSISGWWIQNFIQNRYFCLVQMRN
jgi:hypothetical protein